MPGTRKRTRKPAAERRRQILAAARQVFFRHGYEAATMPQIAGAAGLAAGTLYLHFPSKQALHAALLIEGYAGLADRMEAARPAGAPPDQAAGIIDAYFAFVRANPELFDVVAMVVHQAGVSADGLEGGVRERIAEAEGRCRDSLGRVLELADAATPNRRPAMVAALWSMLTGVALRYRGSGEFERIAAESRDLLLSALFGDVAYLA